MLKYVLVILNLLCFQHFELDLTHEEEEEFELGTLFGTEHPWFWRIHITALVALGNKGWMVICWKKIKIIYLGGGEAEATDDLGSVSTNNLVNSIFLKI